MNERIKRLITEAEEALSNGKYIDAGRFYEKAAESAFHKSQAVKLLKKASEAYKTCGMYKDANRCSEKALLFMDDNQKVQYLMESWRDIIDTITHFEYDCSFEWRGETNGSHDSYQKDIDRLQKEAEDVLKQALSVNGVDREKIIEETRDECRKREKEGGWGASRCWDIIRNVI